MLSFKGMSFCSMFGSNHKDTPLPESTLNNLSFPKNCFHHSRVPADFLKVFKTSNCCIVEELNQNPISPSLKRETARKNQTHQETVFLFLSKMFPFL